MTRRFMVAAVAFGIMFVTAAAGMKEKEDPTIRSVIGTVVDDSDHPLVGAEVLLKDTKTMRIRSFITQKDGKYQFHGISVNVDYELKANYEKRTCAWRSLSSFDSRKIAVINLKVDKVESKKK